MKFRNSNRFKAEKQLFEAKTAKKIAHWKRVVTCVYRD